MVEFARLLLRLFGWKINGEFPNMQKSVVIFAPHTSYWDALFGKLFLMTTKTNHIFLVKKTFFYFPMNIFLKWYSAIPVQGVKGKNAIFEAVDILKEQESVHLIISPEGAMAKRKKWNRGFLYMAQKAQVPIVVGYMDYRKKETGIKGYIEDVSDEKSVMKQINTMYSGVTAKHPDNFAIEQID